jgi:hypothetical protein
VTGPRAPLSVDDARTRLVAAGARAAILVEGWSDEAALEALARRGGRDLADERIAVVPIGGITNLGAFAGALGAAGLGLALAGLCDAAEAPYVARTLHRLSLLRDEQATREAMEALAFFVCDADLEDELIRALGSDAVEHVIEREGELASLRLFQDQPAQRGRSVDAQLRRFLGTRARRKIRYGSLLVEALPLDGAPRPLERVLDAHRRR